MNLGSTWSRDLPCTQSTRSCVLWHSFWGPTHGRYVRLITRNLANRTVRYCQAQLKEWWPPPSNHTGSPSSSHKQSRYWPHGLFGRLGTAWRSRGWRPQPSPPLPRSHGFGSLAGCKPATHPFLLLIGVQNLCNNLVFGVKHSAWPETYPHFLLPVGFNTTFDRSGGLVPGCSIRKKKIVP